MSVTYVLKIGDEIPDLVPLNYVSREEQESSQEIVKDIPVIPENIYQESIDLFEFI